MEKELISLSDCCKTVPAFGPPAFGDPGFYICMTCYNACTYQQYPKYEVVSKGIYRKIKY